MKKSFAILLALAMLLSLAACGGTTSSSGSSPSQSSSSEDSSTPDSSEPSDSSEASTPAGDGRWDTLQTTDEPLLLRVDFHSNTPSMNEEPTEEAPTVFNSSRYLTEDWLADKPNVTVEWTRGKDMSSNETMLEWLAIQMNAQTCPDILFAWGSNFAANGWYTVLDEVIESPNYYEPGNTKWKDMYPDYLWEDSMHVDANGNIVAIPSTVFPGPPTAYYYNTELFAQFNLTPTNDWATFIDMLQPVREAGYVAFAPASFVDNGTWDVQFSLGPYYAISFAEDWDTDGNSIMSSRENTRSLYNGVWYIETNPAVFEMWSHVKDKFTLLCDDGFENIDYWEPWRQGNVAIKEGGIWDYPTHLSDTKRPFDFDLMAPPIIQTSEYVDPVSFTDAGPYMPQPMEAFNVLKAEIQDRPEITVDYAVDFLKYMHTTEHFGMIVEERAGACIGSMKGCPVPAALSDWLARPFPMKPNCSVPSSSTPNGAVTVSKLLESWVKGMIDDDTFKHDYDVAVYNDLMTYIEDQKVEIGEDWELFVPAAVES